MLCNDNIMSVKIQCHIEQPLQEHRIKNSIKQRISDVIKLHFLQLKLLSIKIFKHKSDDIEGCKINVLTH